MRSRWQGDRSPRGRDREDGALRRALPLQGYKAKQAQSRLKQIDKIKRDGRGPNSATTQPALLLQPSPSVPVGSSEHGRKARIEVPGRVLLSAADLEVEREEHVVLVGPTEPARPR